MYNATPPHLALRLFAALFLFLPPVLPFAPAQPPEPPPQIQSQVVDGVRVRVKRAYWDIPQKRHSRLNHPGKGLVIDYEAEYESSPHSGDLFRAVTNIGVQGPNGEEVAYTNLEERNRIFLSDVNPHWPSLSLDFEVQTSPGDQRLAQGRQQSELTFHNLPFPRQLDQSVTLDQTRTTGWGTRDTLQKIALRPFSKRNKAPYYYLTFGFEARPGTGDLAFNIWSSRATFIDLYGNDMSGLWPRRRVENDEKQPATRTQQQWEFSIPQSAFAEQDIPGGLGFKLRLDEWSPQRKQIADFKQFHFELPLATLTDNTPAYQPPAQIEQLTEPVQISAEAWRAEQEGVATLRLWTRPAEAASPNGWAIKSARALERRQLLSREKPPFYRPGRSGWKADGPALPGENSFDYRWVLETPAGRNKPPKTHTLQLELEEVRHAAYRLEFPGLPHPRDKTTLPLNRLVQSGAAQLTVLAVGNYQDNQLPTDWPIARVSQAMPAASTSSQPFLPTSHGIAIACRWTPAGGSSTVQATHRITAQDQHGRALLDQPLNMLLPTAPGKWPVDEFVQVTELEPDTRREYYDFTLFLLPPADDATSFELSFSMQETIATGRRQSAVFALPHSVLRAMRTGP